jgi:hypothetical protein
MARPSGHPGRVVLVSNRVSVFLDVDRVEFLHDRDDAVMPVLVGRAHRHRDPVFVQMRAVAVAITIRHVAGEQPIEKAALAMRDVAGSACQGSIREPDIGRADALGKQTVIDASRLVQRRINCNEIKAVHTTPPVNVG